MLPITSAPTSPGCVAVDGDRIAYVGDARQAPAGDDVDLGNTAVLPGLVNAHTHLELTAFRGLIGDVSFRDWILTLQAAKDAVMTPDDYLQSARLGIVEGLASGITTFADTCDSGQVLQAMRELGVRGIMYREAFGPDPDQCERSISELRAKIDRARPSETPLQRLGVSPHAPYTVSDALFQAVAAYAREERLPMAIHAAESDVEMQLVRDAAGAFAEGLRARGINVVPRGRSPIDLLERLGVLDVRPLLIHCVQADVDDIATIARTGSAVAHCPLSNARLKHGIARLTEMLDAGVTVALGSDSMASNDEMDVLAEAQAAILAQRARTFLDDLAAPSTAKVIELATLGGARAIGLDGEIGSLEKGKVADMVAFELDDRATVADVNEALIFPGTRCRVRIAMVAGNVLVRDGVVLGADPALGARVGEIAQRLSLWKARKPLESHQ